MPKPVNEMTPRELDEEIALSQGWDCNKYKQWSTEWGAIRDNAPSYADPANAWGLLMELVHSMNDKTAEAVKQAYVSWKRGEG